MLRRGHMKDCDDNNQEDALNYLRGAEGQKRLRDLNPELFQPGHRVEGLVMRMPSDLTGKPVYGDMIPVLTLDPQGGIQAIKLQPLITEHGIFLTGSKAQIENAVESRRQSVESVL